jgi:hypothetical protein
LRAEKHFELYPSLTTWDGVVVDKQILQKIERVRYGNKVRTVPYTPYVLKVKRDDGKIFTHSVRDNRAIFDYYQIGERVRHHKGFSYYEKYDKWKDSWIHTKLYVHKLHR